MCKLFSVNDKYVSSRIKILLIGLKQSRLLLQFNFERSSISLVGDSKKDIRLPFLIEI